MDTLRCEPPGAWLVFEEPKQIVGKSGANEVGKGNTPAAGHVYYPPEPGRCCRPGSGAGLLFKKGSTRQWTRGWSGCGRRGRNNQADRGT